MFILCFGTGDIADVMRLLIRLFRGFVFTGDVIEVWYDLGTDDTPVSGLGFTTFSGFRVAPQ